MESVEEMCDHIALINKSNLVLSGKLNEVKQQFRSRNYAVSLIANQPEETFNKVPVQYQPEKTQLKGLDHTLDINITLPENESIAHAITHFSSLGELTHFSEIIPSVNDIFIKTVEQDG